MFSSRLHCGGAGGSRAWRGALCRGASRLAEAVGLRREGRKEGRHRHEETGPGQAGLGRAGQGRAGSSVAGSSLRPAPCPRGFLPAASRFIKRAGPAHFLKK